MLSIDPVGDGNHRCCWTGRAAERRPVAVTVIRRRRRYPSPLPMPSQWMASMVRRISGHSGHPARPGTTMRMARRSFARAISRRAMAGRGGNGGQSTTRSVPSTMAAVASAHAGPGRGTRANRMRSTPRSWEATAPTSGSPMAAHHDPACEAWARRARASVISPLTVPPPVVPSLPTVPVPVTTMVLPRRRPRPGKRSARGAATGNRRVWLDEVGRVRSANMTRDSLLVSLVKALPARGPAKDTNICS